jgi:hypothetical protein
MEPGPYDNVKTIYDTDDVAMQDGGDDDEEQDLLMDPERLKNPYGDATPITELSEDMRRMISYTFEPDKKEETDALMHKIFDSYKKEGQDECKLLYIAK